jgi:hypothetical protein
MVSRTTRGAVVDYDSTRSFWRRACRMAAARRNRRRQLEADSHVLVHPYSRQAGPASSFFRSNGGPVLLRSRNLPTNRTLQPVDRPAAIPETAVPTGLAAQSVPAGSWPIPPAWIGEVMTARSRAARHDGLVWTPPPGVTRFASAPANPAEGAAGARQSTRRPVSYRNWGTATAVGREASIEEPPGRPLPPLPIPAGDQRVR